MTLTLLPHGDDARLPLPQRRALPARRPSCYLKLRWQDRAVHVGLGFCPRSGQLAEIWIDSGKSGSDVQLACHDASAIVSIALQHGVPLAALAGAVDRDADGQPVSLLGLVLLAAAGAGGAA